ncbi:hypothetical protein B0T19DRAFT_478248 [Cercophora scortea]|uniref:Uncharacterized protein n=1 Tax=Cercophora scortea TaxID=314031 RepID=A0AAE0M6S1_9PEZI|nr:hypothetical protein B0T19DRAFT_478248 [Cercophora scortea]
MDDPTTISASLRKDDAIISNILNQLTSSRYKDTNDFTMLMRTIDLERRANTMAETLQRYQYFAEVGDWTAGIINIAKANETKSKPAHWNKLKGHLKAAGFSADDAANMVKPYEEWFVLKGNQSTGCWAVLEGELDRIHSWILEGRPAGKEPESPNLDLNDASHNPPPNIKTTLNADGTIDWVSIRKQCEEKKASVDAAVLAGRFTESQGNQLHDFIDEWLRLHDRGTSEPTKRTGKAGLPRIPPSFYEDGKWDDIGFYLLRIPFRGGVGS